MPRGRPKKEKVEGAQEPVMTSKDGEVETSSEAVTEVAEKPKEEPGKAKVVELTGEAALIAESRMALSQKLDPSQQFFESPEGYIVIGELGRGRVWCRQANGHKGMWINPMR